MAKTNVDKSSERGAVPVSFRLAHPHADRLEAEARSRGESKGEYARQLVIRGLAAGPEAEVAHALGEVREELADIRERLREGGGGDAPAKASSDARELVSLKRQVRAAREDLATLAVALLVRLTGEAPKRAEEFVRQQLMVTMPEGAGDR